jgi:pimeloyl-ACP methyl ester carboxylesterase
MTLGRRRLEPAEMYPAGEQGVSSRMVQLASGLSVRVVESGETNAPAIVLIPGWGCTAWIFHDNIVPLARAGFRVIAVELKGHGLSDKPASSAEYTRRAMRDHFREVVNALELTDVRVLGHSMGAAIAADFAAEMSDRVSALVLVAPVGFDGVRGMTAFTLLTPKAAIPILPWLARRSVIKGMLAVVYGSIRKPSERDVDEFWAPTRFRGFTRAMRHLLHEFTWNAPFPRLEMPLMVVAGGEDVLSPAKEASKYVGGASETRRLIIEDAGHVILDEAPEVLNPALIDFFKATAERHYISIQNE